MPVQAASFQLLRSPDIGLTRFVVFRLGRACLIELIGTLGQMQKIDSLNVFGQSRPARRDSRS